MDKKDKKDVLLLCFLCAVGLLWLGVRLIFLGGRLGDVTLGGLLIFLVLAPVCEELFFRGFLQDWLKRRISCAFYGITCANVITSVLFASVHLFSWTPMHSLLVFIPSVALGLLYDRTGRLIYVILLHSSYNLNVFIL